MSAIPESFMSPLSYSLSSEPAVPDEHNHTAAPRHHPQPHFIRPTTAKKKNAVRKDSQDLLSYIDGLGGFASPQFLAHVKRIATEDTPPTGMLNDRRLPLPKTPPPPVTSVKLPRPFQDRTNDMPVLPPRFTPKMTKVTLQEPSPTPRGPVGDKYESSRDYLDRLSIPATPSVKPVLQVKDDPPPSGGVHTHGPTLDETIHNLMQGVDNQVSTTTPSVLKPSTVSMPKSPQEAKQLLEQAVQTLQEARAERERARQWADTLQQSVTQWVKEQTSPANKNSDSSIRNLQVSLEQLQLQLQESLSERAAVDKSLQQTLKEQQAQIQKLTEQLENMEHMVALSAAGSPRVASKSASFQRSPAATATPAQHVRQSLSATPWSTAVEPPQSARNYREELLNDEEQSEINDEEEQATWSKSFPNGVRQERRADGTWVTRFPNDDVETRFVDGRTAYYYAASQCLQVSLPDRSTLYEYSNGQVERHFPNGDRKIQFPDGSKQTVLAKHRQES